MCASTAPFDSQAQTWEQYCDVLRHFFNANEITDASLQKAILLNSFSSQTCSLMRNQGSPDKPGDKPGRLFKDHFNAKPRETVQRFKFKLRIRKHGEMVMEYVAVLRKLPRDCNHGDKLSEILWDRVVCG